MSKSSRWAWRVPVAMALLSIAAGATGWLLKPSAGSPPELNQPTAIDVLVSGPAVISTLSVRLDQSRSYSPATRGVPAAGRDTQVDIIGAITNSPTAPIRVAIIVDGAARTLTGQDDLSPIGDWRNIGSTADPKLSTFAATVSADKDGRFEAQSDFAGIQLDSRSGTFVRITSPELQAQSITGPYGNMPADSLYYTTPVPLGRSTAFDGLQGTYFVPQIRHTTIAVSTVATLSALSPISTSPGFTNSDFFHLTWIDDNLGDYVARDVGKQDADESRLFIAGVLLGVAGAGAIAAVQEALRVRDA